jgi:hypothetical protein
MLTIYLTVLKNSIHQNYTEDEKEDLYNTLRKVLGSVVSLSSPLSANSLATLLHMPKQDVDQTLEDLHSILDIPRIKPAYSVYIILHFVTFYSMNIGAVIQTSG